MLGAGTGALILFATVQFTILGWALRKGDQPGAMALLGLAAALAGFVYLVLPGLRAPDALGAVLMVVACGRRLGRLYAAWARLGGLPLRDSAQNFVLDGAAGVVGASSRWRSSRGTGAGSAGPSFPARSLRASATRSGMRSCLHSAGCNQASCNFACRRSPPAPGFVVLGEQPTLRLGIATVLILGGVAVAITVRPKAP